MPKNTIPDNLLLDLQQADEAAQKLQLLILEATSKKANTALLEQLHAAYWNAIDVQNNLEVTASGYISTNGSAVTSGQSNTKRYPGHSSIYNKRALLAIVRYRKEKLNCTLSHPEATFYDNNKNNNTTRPETGRVNTDNIMRNGTAICHKISDKSIRVSIDSFLINNDFQSLFIYLRGLLAYIDPAHVRSDYAPTDADSEYVKEITNAYNSAKYWYDMLLDQKSNSNQCAHGVGKFVANSPVNLFIGDSITNSGIQDNFDGNEFEAPGPPSLIRTFTPRTIRAAVYKNQSEVFIRNGVPQFSSRPPV